MFFDAPGTKRQLLWKKFLNRLHDSCDPKTSDKRVDSPVKFEDFYFISTDAERKTLQAEVYSILSCDPYYNPSLSNSNKKIAFHFRHFVDYWMRGGPYQIENVRVSDGDIVIDAGANMGVFSLLAMHQGAEKVYAFEPNPRAYTQFLERNIELNNGQHTIIPISYGLGAKKEVVEFIDVEENIGGSRILNPDKDTFRNGNIISVNITTLDSFVRENDILHVDFIKADIEGAERLMLEGARDTIKRFHPRLSICTYHLPDDKAVLTRIIKDIDPSYNIRHSPYKLYAW